MRQTVVGVFDQFAAAQHAADLLRQRGIDADDIHVTGTDGPGETRARPEEQETGLLEKIKNFFSGDVDDDFEVSAYSEAVRRGGAVVKVDIEDEPGIDVARETLASAGARDIDECVTEWKSSGWSGDYEPRRSELSDTGDALPVFGRGERAESVQGEEIIPVVQEELQVGKHSVKAGGVRVYARLVEERVRESVDLREERANVERRAVDRPASPGDLERLGERTIEIEETVEQPVVQKTARVVEEVVVGKKVSRKKADIDETVRHTEVDVQNLDAGDRTPTSRGVDIDYRPDFDTRFASTGRRYEDYEPAYQFGHTLATDERYAGRDWDDFEPDVRDEWSRSNPGSAWEEIKAAVRHAWERVRS